MRNVVPSVGSSVAYVAGLLAPAAAAYVHGSNLSMSLTPFTALWRSNRAGFGAPLPSLLTRWEDQPGAMNS